MAALIALTAPGWAAERAQATSPEGPLVVVERGADYRVVEWLSSTIDETGQSLVVTNSYTELATGLHFMAEDGQWQETVAEFGLAPGGFVAARSPHQVALSSDLTVPGAVTVVTAEGLTFRLAPILLAYVDRASGASVRLADVQPTTGELIAPNTVLYSQAFDTVSADYRAVYSASGFEADVILRGQLPDPSLFGLNAETTDLEVYTEVFEGQTFNSLTTYYVSGTVNLSVVTTFEPGTVIKYAKTNQPSLKVLANTALTWLGAPYRPLIQISGVEFFIDLASSGWQTVNLENSLFRDCRVTVYKRYTGDMTVSLRNTLFRGGTIILYYYYLDAGGPQWICTDNLFDGASVSAYSTATNRLYAGWNGYSTASAILGGVSNRVGIVADWASGGPLGPWYYPTNGGSTSLYNLVNNGSKLATNYGLYHYTTRTDQTKEGTTQVDIGFHYATTSNGVLADTDLDGIPDVVEDADGNGSVNGSESNWQNADSDGDGALDGEEIANFTNPLDKQSWIPKRLAAWWWEGTTGTWKLGDRGQAPITPTGGEKQTNGIVGSGVYLPISTNAPLRYEFADAYGRPNLRLDQGSVRLWFKPNWTLPKLTNWSATLAQVGKYNDTNLGWWSWYLHSDTNSDFWVKFSQGASNYWPLSRFDSKLDQTNWATAQWHELALVYGRDFLKLFHNSYQNSASTNGVLDYFPTAAGLSNGIHLGSDPTGIYAVEATVDSLETFNYPVGFTELYRHQQLTVNVVTNLGTRALQFTRTFQGAPDPAGSGSPNVPDTWPMTLWHRGLGATNWGTEILANSKAETWIDSSVSPGISYEYQVKFSNSTWGNQYRQLVAGVEMPPQHQRGNVLLLVATNLASALSVELAQLTTNLVGDGWTVKTWNSAPRHDELIWTNNAPNLAAVTNWIFTNYVSNTTNVIFLVGHVTIPYSGTIAEDGHTLLDPPDHRGAWVCDAYYGFLNKTNWTDTNYVTGNSTNDGKFDLDYLPGVPDFAVGRIDFSHLPAFNPLTETDLIRRYLIKDSRYRFSQVPTYGRVSAHLAEAWAYRGLSVAQSLSGAAFGVTPGTLFDGYNLRHKVPADLGVHFLSGEDNWVYDGFTTNKFLSDSFADPAQEVPVTFRNVWFSFASDWARLNQFNRVEIDNNWLRASLGWPNYGLATVGGHRWDFAPMGAGAPLADLMKRGWASFTNAIPRFQSILGDPTLRLHRVSPVSNLSAVRIGSIATVTWSPSIDSGCRYFVYRSTTGLGGFSTPLNPSSPIEGLNFTDSAAPTNALLYQVRSLRLQTTGSGSYWNLSQGTFFNLP